MTKTFKLHTSNEVLKLTTKSTGLRYLIAYKTVGNTPFFSRDDVRMFLLKELDVQITTNKLRVFDVQITDCSISFMVDVPLLFNLKNFMQFTAQKLINQTNMQFPELNLKATAPNGVLSRLWHRPYYVTTVSVSSFQDICDYLS